MVHWITHHLLESIVCICSKAISKPGVIQVPHLQLERHSIESIPSLPIVLLMWQKRKTRLGDVEKFRSIVRTCEGENGSTNSSTNSA